MERATWHWDGQCLSIILEDSKFQQALKSQNSSSLLHFFQKALEPKYSVIKLRLESAEEHKEHAPPKPLQAKEPQAKEPQAREPQAKEPQVKIAQEDYSTLPPQIQLLQKVFNAEIRKRPKKISSENLEST